MTRINTNVSSLTAQHSLGRANTQLQEALTRLSTGLRINTGRDDPAGLIASELLRSDIVSVGRAITNSERANQLVATADSALGQVSGLLNDIRGLVSEAANSGALSPDQIEANQLQIDSSLEAINRIAQTTTFQGRRLLDGSLDFINQGVDSSKITELEIQQANFGSFNEIGVAIEVNKQATKGSLNFAFGAISSDTVLEVGGRFGTEAFTFDGGSTIEEIASAVNLVSDATGVEATVEQAATQGELTVSSLGKNNDVVLTAKEAGEDEGNVRVKYSLGTTAGTTVDYTEASGGNPATVDVKLQVSEHTAAEALRLDDSNLTKTAAAYTIDFNDNFGAGADVTVTAANTGAQYHGISFNFVNDESLASTGDAAQASFDDVSKTLTVRVRAGATTATQVKDAINGLSEFTAAGGDGVAIGAQGNTVTQTAQGIGDDNNALDIVAKITGTGFNGTSVHYVAGNGTNAGITNTLTQRSTTFYGDEAAGTDTANGFKISIREDAARFLGANGGDITIEFTDTNATAGDINDISFNETNKTLTIAGDFSGALTANELVTALNGTTHKFDDFGDGTLNISEVFAAENVGGDGNGGANIGTAVVNNQDGVTLGDNTATQVTNTFAATNQNLTIAARAGGSFDGARGNAISVTLVDSGTGGADTIQSVSFNETTGVLQVVGDFTAGVTGTAFISAVEGGVSDQGNKIGDILDVSSDNAGNNVVAADTAIVTGLLSAGTAGTGDAQATAGEGFNTVDIEYSHSARQAQAAIGLNDHVGGDFIIKAVEGGVDFNDVAITLNVVANGANSNEITIDYDDSDAENKTLTITVEDDNTVAELVTAFEDDAAAGGDFTAELDTSIEGATNTGTYTFALADDGTTADTANTGGDAGTLFVYLEDGVTTAADVVSALGDAGNERANALFSITNSQDSDGSGLLFENTKSDALSGGTKGGEVVATAQDVVDAIAASEVADLIDAELASGNTGITAVDVFQEFAYFGTAQANNRLQFLAPEDAANIRFVSTPGSSLSLDLSTDPQVLANSTATLAAENADASLKFTAINTGTDYDDVVVRFVAGEADAENTVTFDQQESAAEAVLDFSDADADIRLVANTRGDDYNDVKVVVQNDSTITGDNATASYDADAKVLTIKVNDTTTTASTIVDVLNDEGTFTAALDFGDNDENDGSGAIAVADLSTTGSPTATLTGGGHKGGTLEFTIQNGTTTADDVVDLLSNDDYASTFFQAATFGALGTGVIDARTDNNKAVTDGGLESAGTVIINLETDENGLVKTTANDLIEFLDTDAAVAALEPYGISVTNAEGSNGSGLLSATSSDLEFSTSGTELEDAFATGEVTAVNGVNARFTITAINPGSEYDGVTIEYQNTLTSAGDEEATYNASTKTITVQVKAGANASTAAQVVAAINDATQTQGSDSTFDKFTAELVGDGTGEIDLNDSVTLSGGQVDSGTEDGAALLGNADLADTGLTFSSTTFGSDSFVSVKALSGSFELTNASGEQTERDTGTDIDARINGIQAVGNGLKASINTSSLDISFSISGSVQDGDRTSFNITGGGALFQLGPDVVSNQQARLGIQAVSTATLGGVSGKLFELASGGPKSITTDVKAAAAVVEEVITAVTSLRGRLGAFQRTTLETNIATLSVTLENLTEAESSIRDADFATESANLTRAQILVQSSTSVLSIANSNPQNVLSLLR